MIISAIQMHTIIECIYQYTYISIFLGSITYFTFLFNIWKIIYSVIYNIITHRQRTWILEGGSHVYIRKK